MGYAHAAALALLCLTAGAHGELFVRKQSAKTLLQKVPVFLLTNEAGQPYLTSTKEGDQVGRMFLFLKDAERSLVDLQRMPGASDARMWKTDLHRALRMAQRTQSSGLFNEQGRELRMLMRMQPHTRQRTNARMLNLRAGTPFKAVPDVPVFIAEGLAAEKRGVPVVPLFLSKEELDRVWSRMALKGRTTKGGTPLPPSPRVTVTSLTAVMQAVENDPSMRADFYLGDATRDWLAEQRKPTKARIMRARRF